jgi:deoxyribonuclease-4
MKTILIMKILLGPAGSPAKSTLEGLKTVHDLGLQAMEVAFTHGIHMGLELARQIAEENKKYNISLSIHAPYYINLTSTDSRKLKESKQRILDSCHRGSLMGARKIVFHAAYYGKLTKEETYEKVKAEILSLLDSIKDNSWDVELLPETMGRLSQFGDLDEIIQLTKETGCNLCIDPAHLYARNLGRIDFAEMFDKLEELAKVQKMKEMHFHFSGINYGQRGERNHLVLNGKPSFELFARELPSREKSFTSVAIISESPVTWRDSLNMKKMLAKSGYKFN